jgi:hypothetical protein
LVRYGEEVGVSEIKSLDKLLTAKQYTSENILG